MRDRNHFFSCPRSPECQTRALPGKTKLPVLIIFSTVHHPNAKPVSYPHRRNTSPQPVSHRRNQIHNPFRSPGSSSVQAGRSAGPSGPDGRGSGRSRSKKTPPGSDEKTPANRPRIKIPGAVGLLRGGYHWSAWFVVRRRDDGGCEDGWMVIRYKQLTDLDDLRTAYPQQNPRPPANQKQMNLKNCGTEIIFFSCPTSPECQTSFLPGKTKLPVLIF